MWSLFGLDFGGIKMENINIDRIGNDLADAYEEGYQQGVKENKENNKN